MKLISQAIVLLVLAFGFHVNAFAFPCNLGGTLESPVSVPFPHTVSDPTLDKHLKTIITASYGGQVLKAGKGDLPALTGPVVK